MIKVLLVEPQTLVRAGFNALLQTSDQLEVVGEAENGRVAIRLAKKLNPDIVLMDVAMPEVNGIEAAREIHLAQPELRILLLSREVSRQQVFECLQAGASGVVHEDSPFSELLAGIHTVLGNETYLSPVLAELVVGDYFRRAHKSEISEVEILTNREREVLRLIAEGNASAKVAQVMHISVRTVDTHRHNIMKKLNIHSVAGLTKFAIRHGLTSL
jgi:DNA-binding NarL/FixJ family response regulator